MTRHSEPRSNGPEKEWESMAPKPPKDLIFEPYEYDSSGNLTASAIAKKVAYNEARRQYESALQIYTALNRLDAGVYRTIQAGRKKYVKKVGLAAIAAAAIGGGLYESGVFDKYPTNQEPDQPTVTAGKHDKSQSEARRPEVKGAVHIEYNGTGFPKPIADSLVPELHNMGIGDISGKLNSQFIDEDSLVGQAHVVFSFQVNGDSNLRMVTVQDFFPERDIGNQQALDGFARRVVDKILGSKEIQALANKH